MIAFGIFFVYIFVFKLLPLNDKQMHLNVYGKYVLLDVENNIIKLFILLQGWSFGEPQEKRDVAELKEEIAQLTQRIAQLEGWHLKMSYPGINLFRLNFKMSVAKEK